MKLIDLEVSKFVEVLGSDAPAPGGGSASALAGAQGISLTKMVTELTIGKKKYAEYEEIIKKCQTEATEKQKQLLRAIDEDTEAFNKVSAVFEMPKETDEQKAKRKEALQVALQGAAMAPYHMMELMLDALKTTEKAVGKSNTNAASDLGVAALNLKAGLQGAWLNVLINLSSIKDENFVAELKEKGEKTLTEGTSIADGIYQEILKIV